jgi:DNA-directed RNA polymerase subunit RPC12/RpoP
MILEIQPNIYCEKCIKCGARPHIEQQKKYWIVTCPNKGCKNFVKEELVNIDAWNRLNKNNSNLNHNQTFKKTA